MPSLFHRVLIPATFLTGAIFTAMALPLVSVPEEPILVEFQGQPVYQGTLEELAMPYLGFATALSLGVGLTSATLLGWRMSCRKSVRTEEQVSILQRDLREKEALIEELRFSDARLQSSSLDYFLESDKPLQQPSLVGAEHPALKGASTPFTIVYNEKMTDTKGFMPSTEAATASPIPKQSMCPNVFSETPDSVSTPTHSQQILEKARTAMPGAQSYSGYLRQNRSTAETAPQEAVTTQAVSELLHQIRVLMAEVEKHNRVERISENCISESRSNGISQQVSRVA